MDRNHRIGWLGLALVVVLIVVFWSLREGVITDAGTAEAEVAATSHEVGPAPQVELPTKVAAESEALPAEPVSEETSGAFVNRIAESLMESKWSGLDREAFLTGDLTRFEAYSGRILGRVEDWHAEEIPRLAPRTEDALRRRLTLLAGGFVVDSHDEPMRQFLHQIVRAGLKGLADESFRSAEDPLADVPVYDGLAALLGLRLAGADPQCAAILADALESEVPWSRELRAFRMLSAETTGSTYDARLAALLDRELRSDHGDKLYRLELYGALARMPWQGVGSTIIALGQFSPNAVDCLRFIHDPAALPTLSEAFRTGIFGAASGSAVTARAALGLLRINTPTAIEIVANAVRGSDPTLRAAVLEGLGLTRDYDQQVGLLHLELVVEKMLAAERQRDSEFERAVGNGIGGAIRSSFGCGRPADAIARLKQGYRYLIDGNLLPFDHPEFQQVGVTLENIVDQSDLEWLKAVQGRLERPNGEIGSMIDLLTKAQDHK